MTSCAFLPCDQVPECPLSGGCVNTRYKRFDAPGARILPANELKKGARALAGAKKREPAKHPMFKKRHRVGPHR